MKGLLFPSTLEVEPLTPNHEVCVLCDEAITNPICPDCLMKEISLWLNETNPRLMNQMNEFMSLFDGFTQVVSSCVICGAYMNICPHCFAKEVFDTLRVKDLATASMFLKRFNYELDYKFCMK